MENVTDIDTFLTQLVDEISKKDRLHSKKITGNIAAVRSTHPEQFVELVSLIKKYFDRINHGPEQIASDYLKMIKDMRVEGVYFFKHGKYRCENQKVANEYVYSKPGVMTYYMHALLISQILWKHHFDIFMYFQSQLKQLFNHHSKPKILDIGPGHGFFSYLIKKQFADYDKLDIVDISETSLEMTKSIIGFDNNKINYFKQDIFDYSETEKYDFIVLGEVLEHLDDPKSILKKLSALLSDRGLLWITTPTNSPALDHVYLFHTKNDVIELIKASGLKTVADCNYFAENVTEEQAIKNKITNLIGVFCSN